MNAPSSAETANRRAFDAWRDRFFAHYYAARPVNATFIGIHDHDDALPDFSPSGLASHMALVRALRDELALLPQDGVDLARLHDSLLIDGFLELQLLEDTLPQFYRGNPAVYTGEGVFAILALFLRDAEPFADRVQAAITRMRLLPEFLAQGRANVRSAPPAWTDQAIREARASASYFSAGLPRLAAERGIADPQFHAAATTAHDAFVEHARWLEDSLRQRPEPEVACGRATFDRYLRRGHFLPAEHDASWLAGFANRAMARAREALEERAAQLDPTRTWQNQLASVADHHPTADHYYRAFGEVWDAARTAAINADLLTWPDYPIDYVPVPPSDREAAQGLYYLPYRCPAPFGRSEIRRYLVPPLPPNNQPARQQERLRSVNDAAITLNHVVHHGGLGHHVQNWHAFRAASRVGQMAGVDCASRIAMFCGGTLVEGWACYATDLMDEIGFLAPFESLSEAQSRLRMAARAAADVALHTGAATLSEIADFYEREAGMTPHAAHTEAVKNSMFPGAAMMYLIGTDAIHELRTALQARAGAAFSQRAFHDSFLSYGAIPVTLIAQDMLKTPDSG